MQGEKIKELESRYVMQTYGRLPVVFVSGKGSCLTDVDGRRYLDFVSGLAVNALGHCHPAITAAIAEQAGRLVHTSNIYYTEPQVLVAEKLSSMSGLERVFFCNSGAEANEAAIKLARKRASVVLGEGRYEIITAFKSFHGRTMATLTATGQSKYQDGFQPLLEGFRHAVFNDLSSFISQAGDRTCAVMLEPVQGEGGIYAADAEFLQGLRRFCDDNSLLLIFDEVQSGLGRTGRNFAWQHYDVKPDIMTLAKALGGGLPIGAMLADEKAAGAFSPGDHASTFGGNPVACAAAIAFLRVLEEEDILGNVCRMSAYLQDGLLGLSRDLPDFVEGFRGVGLMLALELKVPSARAVVAESLKMGLLLNAIGDTTIRFLPPLNVTAAEIDEALDILKTAIQGHN
ncbi:MAG: aspartate aminotransferase family protein [bacterium]|nr:aspartate aminotransferase family protein [bacterium]